MLTDQQCQIDYVGMVAVSALDLEQFMTAVECIGDRG